MQVIILGIGSPLVVPDRAGPATLVRIGRMDLLFDCGRAVLMRGAAVGMFARDLTALFVTHMHSDHTTDYNDIITRTKSMRRRYRCMNCRRGLCSKTRA